MRQLEPDWPKTLEAFHRWHAGRPERWEFIDGVPKLMAPGSKAHGLLKNNVGGALREALRGGPCRALIDSLSVEAGRSWLIPDVVVDCGPLDLSTPNASRPVIVVEVASPGSQHDDLGRKLKLYLQIQVIHHFLVVSQDERLIVHHERRDERTFLSRLIRDGAIALDPPGITLDLDAIYEGLSFEPAGDP